VKVFLGVAGNFVRAAPDSAVTAEAVRRCRVTAQISTKLNSSHAICGDTALILPTLARTERDLQADGEQFVTVENSMSEVHTSQGRLEPASVQLLSEVAILCRLARRTVSDKVEIPWQEFEANYGSIRDRASRVVPGLHDYNTRVVRPGGITLANPVNEGDFPTSVGRALFTCNSGQAPRPPRHHLLLQTLRSHDQWNTVPYTDNDRYRGIHGSRRVVLVNPDDVRDLGLKEGARVDLVSVWRDQVERRADDFEVVAYPTPTGCAAAYYPETNVLVPLDSVADVSNQPTSKSVVVRLEPRS
jgi:anaerobic selenocysteine-containing dehydrogenase